jgi:hypothetical protein
MAYGIKITLTHNGTTTSPVELRVPMVSVPVGESIELVFDDKVARSYESGQIRQAVEDLLITTSFNVGTEFSDEVGGGGGFVTGWTTFNGSDPTEGAFPDIGVGDKGYLIRGASDNSKMAFYYDDSSDRLYIKGEETAEGSDVYVEAGHSTLSDGGRIRLYGGNSVTGDGGYVRLRGGYANNNFIGGYLELQGGDSANGEGGYIHLDAGNGNGSVGGHINLTAGTGSTIGGAISIHAGQGNGGNGGDVTIEGGYSGGAGNRSGEVNISSGETGGLIAGATVGDVNIFTPNADTDSYAGDVNITAGDSGPTFTALQPARVGGSVEIRSGISLSDTDGSHGGNVTVHTGNGGGNLNLGANAGAMGNAGSFNVVTGNAQSRGLGGDIYMATGIGVGAGNRGGDIILDPAPAVDAATAGQVILYNTVRLGDYNTNGLVTTSNSDGTLATLTHGYGRVEVTFASGAGLSINVDINDTKVTLTNTILVSVEVDNDDMFGVNPPRATIRGRTNGTKAVVRIDYNNGSAGNITGYLNYQILG